MTSCCRARQAEEMFRPQAARQSLDAYRRKGLGSLSRRMVEAAITEGVDGARVLDLGGGIGALQSELLRAGAARGEIVELVGAYEECAYELARESGLEGRVSYRVADLLESTDAVRDADVVILNRVVCCSPDGIELAGAAARLARRTVLMSFPRDVVWARVAVRTLNAGLWALRRSFRTFVHPTSSLLAAVEEEGFGAVTRGNDAFWEFVVLRRERPVPGT